MALVLVIILGLVVGSFLNAVIYRLHVKVSFLKGRSYCPFCKHDLHFWDLVPVFSFIFLKARCRYCHKPIAWQYPLVELGTAVVFSLLYWRLGLGTELFIYFLYACFLMVIFVYDLRYYLILDKVSLLAIVVAIPLSLFVLKISVIQLALGALVGGGFFFLQFIISRGKWIGGGDIRLGVLMGVMLGFSQLLVALFVAYLIGSVVGVTLVVAGKKRWQSQVPFGTFLTAATVLTFLFGETVMAYYRNLFLL